MPRSSRPRWWGSRPHIIFTVVVFVALASLDNAAAAIIPAMVLPVTDALDTSETAVGILVASVILTTAASAVVWGYFGDRGSRKRLLFWGTLVWVVGAGLSAVSNSYLELFLGQLILAVGLGAIASVGFSVVSDFVSPRRRGLAMSFWGLSQGIGGLAGGLLGSQLGADDFRTPLAGIAILGAIVAVLYLTTFEAPRGYREPELEAIHESGQAYEYRIERSHIPELFQRRTNVWLIVQGLSAQVAFGSLIWVPLLYQSKVMAEGYDVATATKVGGLLGAVFQVGALFSIVAGWLGDRYQARHLSARAVISTIGTLGAIPFFLAFFFLPLSGLTVTPGADTLALIPEVLREVATNPAVTLAFVVAIVGLALTSAESPNWFALISDVNLPEHRGTVFGLGNFANGIGRAAGNGITGVVAGALRTALPPPLNWAVGLAIFQVFFLPTGYCYWRATKSSPGDILEVRAIMRHRAEHPGPPE